MSLVGNHHVSALIVAVILANMIGLNCIGQASATFSGPPRIFILLPTSGPAFLAGTVSKMSIAVAAFYSPDTSGGAGSFAGDSNPFPFTKNRVSGIFTLTTTSSDLIPLIPCISSEMGAVGTIIAGNFTGQTLIVFGCLGAGAPGGLRIIDAKSGSITYDGQGSGDAMVPASPVLAGTVLAGNTAGSGSAGSGSVDTAQVVVTTYGGQLIAGGAFVGIIDGFLVSGVHSITKVSVQIRCKPVLTGVVTIGSFRGLPVQTKVTPSRCPPTSLEPGMVALELVIGPPSAPSYAASTSGGRYYAVP